jgi:uncharacterized protein VirK/YbjX
MEAGGQPLPCGNLEVPVQQPARDIQDVPSKKRAAYRRKRERVAGIQAAVGAWLSGQLGATVPASA